MTGILGSRDIYLISKKGVTPKQLKLRLADLGVISVAAVEHGLKVGAYLGTCQAENLQAEGFSVDLVGEPISQEERLSFDNLRIALDYGELRAIVDLI
jgi:hypothetical protein